jgi:hypothetical protein
VSTLFTSYELYDQRKYVAQERCEALAIRCRGRMLAPVGISSIVIALYKSGNACANLMHVAASPAYSRDRGFNDTIVQHNQTLKDRIR